MADYFDRIAGEWRARAKELASWTAQSLVNRTDVWGRYLSKRSRHENMGRRNHAVTVPFREERGKVFLGEDSLEKHFKTRDVGGVLGLHSSGSDLTSRWFAVDIDLHDDDDLSVSPEGNFAAAKSWHQALAQAGFDPLLLDSNGRGGFHLLIVLESPMSTASVHQFAVHLTADWAKRGLDTAPEVFPGQTKWDHYGSWLRLFGRHHTHDHYTRVFDDEPWADPPWLEGHEAIDRILATRPAPRQVCEQAGMRIARRTVCLDFDGVIHSYRSPWCGAEIIPDPPIHGSREAIAELRQRYRVVVHSARCATEEGTQAVRAYLATHGIQVDDVCRFKPPASIYVDDRGLRFEGDWQETRRAIDAFRR
ncbi:MAG: hypothetical protein AAF802_31710 [Planctomycetota bacterium]